MSKPMKIAVLAALIATTLMVSLLGAYITWGGSRLPLGSTSRFGVSATSSSSRSLPPPDRTRGQRPSGSS
jgi:hypothetical protein